MLLVLYSANLSLSLFIFSHCGRLFTLNTRISGISYHSALPDQVSTFVQNHYVPTYFTHISSDSRCLYQRGNPACGVHLGESRFQVWWMKHASPAPKLDERVSQ